VKSNDSNRSQKPQAVEVVKIRPCMDRCGYHMVDKGVNLTEIWECEIGLDSPPRVGRRCGSGWGDAAGAVWEILRKRLGERRWELLLRVSAVGCPAPRVRRRCGSWFRETLRELLGEKLRELLGEKLWELLAGDAVGIVA
jgi:hypothetical protein